jgi:hypothetical protein
MVNRQSYRQGASDFFPDASPRAEYNPAYENVLEFWRYVTVRRVLRHALEIHGVTRKLYAILLRCEGW